ncbi:hypothetical protein SAMN06265365_14531 [Tistlia consotensis]|uniref:Nuclease-related domain-containing protein n=1 Tax=Tistlia consotensis USBA 355 TaxID=560819 RepID=A0A1Y6CL97_9PROT|nr:hypothetical protein [Tistlia consotensis]SMF73842.1 hypothetical protein SAMN05428998_13261 [Tistlia consotensis USBA 355]SNS28942.1 hypothetical protein SAMN06265365_14531 [Tistlia consotensis]
MSSGKPGLEDSLPGYASHEIPTPKILGGTDDWNSSQWQKEFDDTRERIVNFLAARDPLAILARTAARHIMESTGPKAVDEPSVDDMEQVEVEIAQALILTGEGQRKNVPTSPRNFERHWKVMARHIHGFIRKQPEEHDSLATVMVRRKARLQTLYYRNLFARNDCETVMLALLKRIDSQSEAALGYRLSDVFNAMIAVTNLVTDRLHINFSHIRTLMQSKSRSEILQELEFFRSQYPLADRCWRDRSDRFPDLEELRVAAFQMSEMAWPWVFRLKRSDLEEIMDSKIVDVLFHLSIPFGGLRDANPQHVYLNNPVWRKPYVRLSDDQLFAAIPQLIFSFPFAIMEGLIEDHPPLVRAYEEARAEYLEVAIEEVVSAAMPHARVFRGVVWTDPESGKTYENDVVALLGNFIFVFECKSGRLRDAARRGGDKSLRTNFRELFVEPGLQGWRLQNYLDTLRDKAVLRLKVDGSLIDFQLDRPKVVYRYSVSFEHFTNLTSARFYLRELGLIENETAWAPALTLGEFQMIAKFLDTEASFQHYLTRRPSIDEIIDFDGDEQDILSMYLTNGLCIDGTAVSGKKLTFLGADALVRQRVHPRKDRTAVEPIGVYLSPMWRTSVRELYANTKQRHRYDIINVILNQLPPALMDFERRIRRFRRGVPNNGEDVLVTKFLAGNRIFVLMCHLAKKAPDPDEWQDAGRSIVGMFSDEDTVVECATFLFVRRSKETTFDGVGFYRYGFGKMPKNSAMEE